MPEFLKLLCCKLTKHTLIRCFRCDHNVMAADIIQQVEPHIREIVRIYRVLEAEGRELHELNELVGRTCKFGEHVQASTKGML